MIPLKEWWTKSLHYFMGDLFLKKIKIKHVFGPSCALSLMATWRANRWRCSCSLAPLMTGFSGLTPSTRSTASPGRLCPPRVTRPCTTTPKSWRSHCCQKTTWGQCEYQRSRTSNSVCLGFKSGFVEITIYIQDILQLLKPNCSPHY